MAMREAGLKAADQYQAELKEDVYNNNSATEVNIDVDQILKGPPGTNAKSSSTAGGRRR